MLKTLNWTKVNQTELNVPKHAQKLPKILHDVNSIIKEDVHPSSYTMYLHDFLAHVQDNNVHQCIFSLVS
jgi:hypothetical protein